MSWNPSPTYGSASWQGNAPLVTKNQLLSTSQGLYETSISTINVADFNVSTLRVQNFIEAPIARFSTVEVESYVSAQTGYFSSITGVTDINTDFLSSLVTKSDLVLLSTIVFEGPKITNNFSVSFDFHVGDALSGLLTGLGFLIFETLLGLGAGLGAAFQGIGNGIAAMIMARGSNTTYINNQNFELIGGSTQLQISTLGSLFPLYSSITRYVSSTGQGNQVPGQEVFISTFFQPGQICIRSISDPFPMVTGNSTLNTCTIQQFGEWVPLEGLEPEDISANTIRANSISSLAIETYGLVTNIQGVASNLSMNYDADLLFNTGSFNYGRFVGTLNNMYLQTDTNFIFTRPGTSVENASLLLGDNANESFLNVSSIFSRGYVQANSGFYSTLQVEQLIIISSLSTVFTQSNVNVLSTFIVTADFLGANESYISSLTISTVNPFQINGVLGNSNGPFDITRTDSVISTSYNQISSLQQNILSYAFNTQVQDEPVFDIGDPPLGVTYNVTPANISQWGSSIIQYSGINPGGVDLGWVGQWGVTPGQATGIAAPGGATFDILVNPSNAYGGTGPFYLTQESNNAYPFGISTFFQVVPGQGQVNPNVYKFRLTLPPVIGGSRSGWWQVQSGYTPYATSNNNTFQIYQDMNDTYITATDRLHIQAGDIQFQGDVIFSNATYNQLSASNFTACNIFASNTSTQFAYISSVTADTMTINPVGGGYNSYYLKSSVSYNAQPTTVNPLNLTFRVDSPDFQNIFSLLAPFQGSNQFNSYNYTWWNNAIFTNQITSSLGPPGIFLGDINTTLGPYAAGFWINNTVVTPPYAIPVYSITSAGSNLVGSVTGGTYARITTTNGTSWTITSNVTNPAGSTPVSYSNTVSMIQSSSNTQLTGGFPLQMQFPQVNMVTQVFNLFGDQIRVNSHRYGSAEASGLPSFPIGIQTGTYIDPNISWTQVPPASGLWQSDATNVIYGIQNIFFDINSYLALIVPSRFRTNSFPIYSWDVQVAVLAVPGGGYCWGFNRYIQVASTPSGPGVNTTDNWNEWIMIPKNYCTY